MRVTACFHGITEKDAGDLGDAFWLADTRENRALAEKIRTSVGSDPGSAIFSRKPGAPFAEELLQLLDNIDTHHPDWLEIQLLGETLTPEYHDVLQQLGFRGEPNVRGLAIRRL